jgi:membrane protease YdiL (CAAX protease family)
MNKEKGIIIAKCSLIIFLVFIPNIYNSIIYIIGNDDFNYFFTPPAASELTVKFIVSWLIHSLQILFPVFLVMYLSREDIKSYGLIKAGIKDYFFALLRMVLYFLCLSVILGIVLFLIILINNDIMEYANNLLEIDTGKGINKIPMILLSIVPLILGAFTEELCFRSYLYRNINKLIANKWICILITNILFAMLHIYQGIMGFLVALIFGIVLSLEFKRKNNIYTITIFHAIKNLLAFVMY